MVLHEHVTLIGRLVSRHCIYHSLVQRTQGPIALMLSCQQVQKQSLIQNLKQKTIFFYNNILFEVWKNFQT